MEIEQLEARFKAFDDLEQITASIARLRDPDAHGQIDKTFTKPQLLTRYKNAWYRGEKVSSQWSKQHLVEAAIYIELDKLHAEKRRLEKLCGR
jgi:hypothetical protein